MDYDIQALARERTPESIEALTQALRCPKERVAAAIVLLSYGWGRPSQAVTLAANVVVEGGIEMPPRPHSIEETERWLEHRRKQLAELTANARKPVIDVVAEEQSPAPQQPLTPPPSPHSPPPSPHSPPPPSSPPRAQTVPGSWSSEQELEWERQEQRREHRGDQPFGRWPPLPR
jgi:hypothetical protein